MRLLFTVLTFLVLYFIVFMICAKIEFCSERYIRIFDAKWFWIVLGGILGQVSFWFWYWAFSQKDKKGVIMTGAGESCQSNRLGKFKTSDKDEDFGFEERSEGGEDGCFNASADKVERIDDTWSDTNLVGEYADDAYFERLKCRHCGGTSFEVITTGLYETSARCLNCGMYYIVHTG